MRKLGVAHGYPEILDDWPPSSLAFAVEHAKAFQQTKSGLLAKSA